MSIQVISTNRKARFEYHIIETFEAGIALKGSEIKSIRDHHVSLAESYVRTDGHEAFLVGANISPYEQASMQNHDPMRERKLLLHKREIAHLWDEVRKKGMTVIPTQLYLKDGRAKVEIALAKGKQLYDKRETIKKRDLERELPKQLDRRNTKNYD